MILYLKNHSYKILAFVFFLITLLIHSGNYAFQIKIPLNDYIYTQWLFDYNFGFIKRAFIGELLYFLDIDPHYKNIRIITFIIFIILFSLYSRLIYRLITHINLSKKISFYLFTSILALSFTTTQFLEEIGRFDQIGQIFTILIIFLIINKTKESIILALLFIFIPIMATTHEAILIIFIPSIMYIYYLQYKKPSHLIFISIYSIIALAITFTLGKMSSEQANAIISKYENYKYFQAYAVNTSLLSLKENIVSSFSTFISTRSYIKILFAILYSLPLIIFIKKSTQKYFFFSIIIFSASPLILSITAFDYLRWYSLFLFNITIVFSALVLLNKLETPLIAKNLIKYKSIIIIYASISFLVGSLGTQNLFPEFYAINNSWEKREEWDQNILIKLNDPLKKLDIKLTASNELSLLKLKDLNYLEKKEIMEFLLNSENKKSFEMQNTLGFIYFYGLATPIQYCTAFNLFQKSAQADDPHALNNLSYMYRYGICAKADPIKANQLLIRAAALGNSTSKLTLAKNYIYATDGFSANCPMGLKYLHELAQQGNLEANIILTQQRSGTVQQQSMCSAHD